MNGTYKYRPYQDGNRCSQCRNYLPLSDAGCCQRCDEGWDGFLDLVTASDSTIQREIGLASYAATSDELRGRLDLAGKLWAYVDKLKNVLKNHGELLTIELDTVKIPTDENATE